MSPGLARPAPAEKPPISGPGLLLSLAAAVVFPFDRVLAGMVAAGQGIEALCRYLGLSREALDHNLIRLGLRTPHDRPLRNSGPKGWSALDTMCLIFWRSIGVHPETIGLRLGRSANAVRAKSRRLGVPTPDRKILHRADPASLTDPTPGFGFDTAPSASPGATPASRSDRCGTAAGPIEPSRQPPAVVTPPHPVASAAVSPAMPSSPASPSRAGKRAARVPGQREFQLFRFVGGSDSAPIAPVATEAKLPAAAVAPTMPRTEAEVDFNGDLTWIAGVRRPLTNRLVVWVLGMLVMGGLHYRAAAARVGKTPAAFRTLRTRCGIPVDYGRRKFGAVFDQEVAQATCAQSGYVVKQYIGEEGSTPLWFWAHKRDPLRTPPMKRHRDHLIEGRSDMFTLCSRDELLGLPGRARMPFAERSVMTQAG